MVIKADVMDFTYEPYHIPGVVSQEAQNVLGAKNLCKTKSINGTSSGLTYFTNKDKTVTVSRENTSSSTVYINVCNFTLPKGRYIFSGCPANSLSNKIGLFFRPNTTTQPIWGTDFGNSPKIMTLEEDMAISGFIQVSGNTNVGTQIFKPMIRLAEIQDDTYTPPTMTNRELTNLASEFISLESQVTMLEQTHYSFETTADTRWVKIYNGYLIVRLSVTDLDIDSMPSEQTFTEFLSIPDNYTLLQSPRLTVVSDNNASAKPIQMECSAHRLSLRGGTPNAHYNIYCLIPVRY